MRRLTAGGGRVAGAEAMQPNTASRWGLLDARGHEQPSVGRVGMLWSGLGGSVELNAPGVNLADPRSQKLLDVFGVRAILTPTRPPLRGAPVEYRAPAASSSPTPGRCRRRSWRTGGARAPTATRRRS